jgi:predicted small metal-binding protein
MAKRWSCVEAGCDWAVTAPDVDQIVVLVQAHIADVHSSFELEEMIEAVLEDVADGS